MLNFDTQKEEERLRKRLKQGTKINNFGKLIANC